MAHLNIHAQNRAIQRHVVNLSASDLIHIANKIKKGEGNIVCQLEKNRFLAYAPTINNHFIPVICENETNEVVTVINPRHAEKLIKKFHKKPYYPTAIPTKLTQKVVVTDQPPNAFKVVVTFNDSMVKKQYVLKFIFEGEELQKTILQGEEVEVKGVRPAIGLFREMVYKFFKPQSIGVKSAFDMASNLIFAEISKRNLW